MPAIIIVRPYTTDAETGALMPTFPATTDVQLDADRCLVVWPRGRDAHPRTYLRCRIVALRGSSCALVAHGPKRLLAAVRDASPNAWTLVELRTTASTVGKAIRANWIDDRPRSEADGKPIGTLVAMRGGYADAAEGLDMAGDLETTATGWAA